MGFGSKFKAGKYFDKTIAPKCDYCQFGKRTKAGNKVLCEKKGLVEPGYSCGKFVYSPLKRIPVKQLNFVGSLADEDIYIESAGDRAEQEELEKEEKGNKKAEENGKDSADENKDGDVSENGENEDEKSEDTEDPDDSEDPDDPENS